MLLNDCHINLNQLIPGYPELSKLMLVLGCILSFTGCVSVDTYQKMYLNDRDMNLELPSVQAFEVDFQSFREGASGANGGKTGGGCGCN